MRKTLPLLLLTLLTASANAASTQSDAARDIEKFVDQVLREVPEVPSLGVAIVRDGKTVYLREANTGYYIGSTTKAYTGLACTILAARGKLDLDAPLTKYLPEVRMAPPLDASKVTLRKLLSHSSGILNNAIVYRTAFTGEHDPKLLVSLLNSSTPGKNEFRYDNLGYVVASLVIERVTGKPWQKALDELVFTPLGMNHTSAYMSEAQKWPMAEPHQINRKGEVEVLSFRKNDQMMHAAGGIVTTPSDLARWLSANIKREGGRIPRAAFEEAQKLQAPVIIERGAFKSSGYGFGWYLTDYKGERAYFHSGGFEGWQSAYSFLPDRKIGVGLMTNASGPAARVLQLVTEFINDRLLDKPVDGAAMIESIKNNLAKGRAAMLAEVEKRSQRSWTLLHSNEAYVGRYENPLYGTMKIAVDNTHLIASLGKLGGVLEAFTEPETARVELIPGSGEVLRFSFSGEKPESIKLGDDVFRRVE
jgi:CubicO group peptidase (beta-lactamase class C family)